jgi:hypothetical protein
MTTGSEHEGAFFKQGAAANAQQTKTLGGLTAISPRGMLNAY